jgi:exopolysaccharide biosynthesis polyprenyl glycosylphosphotransferase
MTSEVVARLSRGGVSVQVSASIPIPVFGVRARRASLASRTYSERVAKITLQRRSRGARLAKRVVDIVLSAVGLVVLSPVLLALALAVRLTSRGPALFVHKRCGLAGRKFRFYKFRTMVQDAEAKKRELEHLNEMTGPAFKLRGDPRITRLGGVLRKTSLDELPQLWNVLRGDMSLVGPRPPTPDEVERYTTRQIQRLSVTPGITGLWQVSGRSDIADFDRWVDHDLTYARSWSMWLDLRILLKTILVVAQSRGAR